MSLINQMLQDLEKRRASSVERGVLPHHVRLLPQSARWRVSVWLIAAAVAIVVLAVLAWYSTRPTVMQRESLPLAAVLPLVAGPVLQVAAVALPPEVESANIPAAAPLAAPASLANVSVRSPIATSAVIMPDAPIVPTRAASVPAPPPESRKTEPVAEASVPTRAAAPAAAAQAAPSARRAERVNRAEEKMQVVLSNAQFDKRTQQLTPQQLAENDYRDAANLLNQGRPADAQHKFKTALHHHPPHIGARQALFGLLLESKRTGEAEQLLQEGLQMNPHQPGFAMALARMQVDRGDTTAAADTLHKTAPAAVDSPDYLAFLAALLQRQSRHVEAVDHYRAALTLAPASGVWLMGLGISLQALNRTVEARDALRRARASNALNADLQAFVDQRLRQLQ